MDVTLDGAGRAPGDSTGRAAAENTAADSVGIILVETSAGALGQDVVEAVLREAGLAVAVSLLPAGADLAEACARLPPDIVLVDMAGPGAERVDVAALIAAVPARARLLVLTGGVDASVALAAMAAGAFDYVEADRLARLPVAIRRALADLRTAAHARMQARTDALSGLANRTAFLERVTQGVRAARRSGESFAVLYLDVDNFKDVNDTLGHRAGDGLLCKLAERLRANTRETDLTARLGGDEFAVLQSDVREPTDCGTLAAKLLAAISLPFHLDGVERHVSASIGIALHRAGLPLGDELMMQADTALYRAKDEGRNRYCFFAPELDDQVRERVSLSEELRGAMDRGELVLRYQPQVSQPTGRIVGLEALVRWNHPRRGELMPGSFIPTAEKTGLISAIDMWVLRSVCAQIAAWRTAGVPVVKVAINLTASAFRRSKEFVARAGDILHEFAVSPFLLDFEIAEASLNAPDGNRGVDLNGIQMLGVRLVADRFGLNQTSLENLGTFGFAQLKIAPRLVGGTAFDGRDRAIVRAAIALATELGVSVVATGVETEEQLQFLMKAGCSVVQGFHLCPPIDPRQAAAALRGGTIGRADPAHSPPSPRPLPEGARAERGGAMRAAIAPLRLLYDDMVRLLENLPVAICVLDAGSDLVVHANEAFVELFQAESLDLTSMPEFWERTLPDPALRRDVTARIARLLDSGMMVNSAASGIEVSMTRGAGEPRFVDIRTAQCGQFNIVAFFDITEMKSREDRLRVLATFDDMTSFLNRREFLAHAATEVAWAHAHGEPLSLVVFDLDNFKTINDAHGHATGDHVLEALPKAVRQWLRQDDIVGRMGGEEFMMVLPHTPIGGAMRVAERVRISIKELSVMAPDGSEVKVTASFGIGTLLPGEAAIDNLMVRADSALYASKRAGRDRITVPPVDAVG